MKFRKSNGLCDNVSSRDSSDSERSSSRWECWQSDIHQHLISFVENLHLVHQLATQIMSYSGCSLKRFVAASHHYNSLKRSIRYPKEMAEVEHVTKITLYQSDDSQEENVVRNTSPCNVKRKCRPVPLRAIQHIVNRSSDCSELCVPVPLSHSPVGTFDAYGHTLRDCCVVVERCSADSLVDQSEPPEQTTEEAEPKKDNDEDHSDSQQNNENIHRENNEVTGGGSNGTSSDSAGLGRVAPSPQSIEPTAKIEPEEENTNTKLYKIIDDNADSSDEETMFTFKELFAPRNECDLLDSDTEEFWAERKKFRNEIDYEKEAKELLGLNADFSTPILSSDSERNGEASSDSSQCEKLCSQKSSISTAEHRACGQFSRRRRSLSQTKKTSVKIHSSSASKIPKWQRAKKFSVKISRSGRLIKPPVDDRFV